MRGDSVTLIDGRVKAVEKQLICQVIQNWYYDEFN
jgi:hypothetical protein